MDGNYFHAIRLLDLAADGARSNAAHQESFGTKAEAMRQRRLQAEYRGAIKVLEMADGKRSSK